jgi:UDP-N-acetylmuramyl pentapeptide phosphotransferase/UDP-N-acetylglucosamine-1-phosphate transferase
LRIEIDPLQNILDNYVFSPLGFIFMLWGLSWALMLACGHPLIAWLKQRKGMKWAPREDTPDSHGKKAGTPSMGGIGIIGAALVGYIGVLAFGILVDVVMQLPVGIRVGEMLVYFIFPAVVGLHAVLGLH